MRLRVGWRWALGGAALAWLAVLPTFALGVVPLEGPLPVSAYWISEVGGPKGLPVVALVLLALFLSRPGPAARHRVTEAVLVIGALAVFLGGGAWLNEHVIKPAFAVPRPNIVALGAAGTLGLSPEAFYDLGDKAARSAWLAERLPHAGGLAPEVRSHWVAETGFSFPSGHAFAALFFATFFAGLAGGVARGFRRWAALAVVPLAVTICWARPLLRVHSAVDVTAGAVWGTALACLALLVLDRWFRRSNRLALAPGRVG